MDKKIEDKFKESFIKLFDEHLIQMDENAATFEFEGDDNPYIINKPLKDFLDVLEVFYSDYQVRISRTSGHPTIQVFMRLEAGLWKVK